MRSGLPEILAANERYASDCRQRRRGCPAHPLFPRSIPIHGDVHDIRSGRLIDVPAAAEAGTPGRG